MMGETDEYDVIVVGGGHAGAEASRAAARLGAETALVTLTVEAIARMSCNPAIGGLAKGQIVREIDALGGLMALAIDATGIQFRMLNRRKGPAVWSPRAQADGNLYGARVREILESTHGLTVIAGSADEILVENDEIRGLVLADGRRLSAPAVVLTPGTFLRGLMHCGKVQTEGGRVNEPASVGLSASLERLGLTLGRLKTGTPPRIHRDSIDFRAMQTQAGDEPPLPFSFMNDRIDRPQVNCWITYTNSATHEVIRANLDRAPLFSGQITSTGPRYCPSIEDKIVRFADRDRHQIFLEPEGLDNEWIYCNGISTSLPVDVQQAMVHSIAGLERAHILQPGYAIEYDFVPPDQIDATLQAKRVRGLFMAGQINGTSGYEEAAGLGLLAGVNAARQIAGREGIVLGRDEAYIGVMVDDLITRPPVEPYRMFTSRAEYRLLLRSDNADARLTPVGKRIGLVDDARWQRLEQKQRLVAHIRQTLESGHRQGRPTLEWLRRPEIRIAELVDREAVANAAAREAIPGHLLDEALQAVEIEVKYGGYIERQQRQIDRFRQMESRPIPRDLDYSAIPELRAEARERLTAVGPRSIGQAGRISGINPADITILMVCLDRRRRLRAEPNEAPTADRPCEAAD